MWDISVKVSLQNHWWETTTPSSGCGGLKTKTKPWTSTSAKPRRVPEMGCAAWLFTSLKWTNRQMWEPFRSEAQRSPRYSVQGYSQPYLTLLRNLYWTTYKILDVPLIWIVSTRSSSVEVQTFGFPVKCSLIFSASQKSRVLSVC